MTMRFFSATALLLCSMFAGCSSPEEGPDCTTGKAQAYVLTALSFTRENPRGTAVGFDLDGRVTTKPEDQTCGKVDLVGPNGEQGIDNQLALFVPEIEKRVGNAVDGIIQGAINDGRLLIMLDLANVDDTQADSCVNMEVKLAEGKPLLGTDGVVEAYQTFDLRKTDQKVSRAQKGTFQNGTFEIGPFDLHIPIAIFDVSFMIHLRNAKLRFKLDAHGDAEGLLGGGISIDEIADGVQNGAGVADIVSQIRFLGKAASDLGYDEESSVCTLLSATLSFKARPAFVRK
jgi:hypothetical protein